MIPPPTNFRYNSDNRILSWDPVPEAEEYLVEYKESLSPNWQLAYSGGNATESPFEHDSNTYSVQGKTKKSGSWGNFSPTYEIIVP